VLALPRPQGSLTLATFDDSLAGTAQSCDLSALRFIDAYGLVGLSCALLGAIERNDRPALSVPVEGQVRTHLALMGFRDLLLDLGYTPDLPEATAAARPDVLVPLARFGGEIAAHQLSELLWEQLRNHADPQVLEAAGEGLWELVGNALEHSGSEAVVMGQVYRRRRKGEQPQHARRVQIVIGDTGKGIRASFLESGLYNPANDAAAIELALQYLVTSVDDPGRGQGLSTTMEQVLELHGDLVVRSGASKVTVGEHATHVESVPFLGGTLVCMSLPL
jgi:anti-sigma regulatory factor (Ser/Thr protein kinase)